MRLLFYNSNVSLNLNVSQPLELCKSALDYIETRNEDRFIQEVLIGLAEANFENLKIHKSLARLYKSIQVISKVTTEEKLLRFKKLTINGIIYQEVLSDNDYELYVNIIDELTDMEFIILNHIYNIEKEHKDETINIPISDEIGNRLLFQLDMDAELFSSYIGRLKAKGLINSAHGHWLSYSTPFYLNIVDGRTSVLFQKLVDFINR